MTSIIRPRFILAFLVAVFAALAITSGCSHGLPVRGPVSQYNATVKFHVVCVNMLGVVKEGWGSGVVVSKDRVLTAMHVVECPSNEDVVNVTVDPGDGVEHFAEVEIMLPELDIARVHVVNGSLAAYMTPIVIGPAPQIGDTVCESAVVPRATYRCDVVQPPLKGPNFHVGMFIEHGNSGAAVYNTRGELVGLTDTQWGCEYGIPCVGGIAPLQGLDWLIPGN